MHFFKTLTYSVSGDGKMHFDDINLDRVGYNRFLAYSRTKFANILFAKELGRRLAGDNWPKSRDLYSIIWQYPCICSSPLRYRSYHVFLAPRNRFDRYSASLRRRFPFHIQVHPESGPIILQNSGSRCTDNFVLLAG